MFDKELKSGQRCPLCWAGAEELDMSDVDRLLRRSGTSRSLLRELSS